MKLRSYRYILVFTGIIISWYSDAGVTIGSAKNIICNGRASTFGITPGGSGAFSVMCHTPNTPQAWGTGKPYSWMSSLTSVDTLNGQPFPSSSTVHTGHDGSDYKAATGVYGENAWWSRITYDNTLHIESGGVYGQLMSAPPAAKAESTVGGGEHRTYNELYTVYAKPINRIEGWQNLPLGTHTFQRVVTAGLQSGVFYNSQYMSQLYGDYSVRFSQTITVARECNITADESVLRFGEMAIGQSKQLPLGITIDCDYPVVDDKQITMSFSLSGDLSYKNREIILYKTNNSGQKEVVNFDERIPTMSGDNKFFIELSPNDKSTTGDKATLINITVANK